MFGEIFKHHFIANLSPIVLVKRISKIGQYLQEL